MMDNLNEDIAARLAAALKAGLGEETMAAIKKQVSSILYDIETDLDYRLKDDLAPNLAAYVAEMAKRTVEAILAGNQGQMERYLGCERGHWTGRSDSPQYGHKQGIDEWHSVIHGKIFETGAVELRKKIVSAHRDLIASQRILDLEDQLASVVAQNNKLADELECARARLREYT